MEEMDNVFSVEIVFFFYKCWGFNNMKNIVWILSFNKIYRKDKYIKVEKLNERNNCFFNRVRIIYYIWF